jgi:hypothetical protein
MLGINKVMELAAVLEGFGIAPAVLCLQMLYQLEALLLAVPMLLPCWSSMADTLRTRLYIVA